MKIKIVEQKLENQLWQLSTSWCPGCWVAHQELHQKGIKHVYVDPEKKFVTKHFSSQGSEKGDIKLAQKILKQIKIKGWPTFVVYKKDGTLSEISYGYEELVKKYKIPGWS